MKGKTSLTLTLIICLFCPIQIFGGGKKPASKTTIGGTEKLVWVRDGERKSLTVTDIGLQDYFSIEELARLSKSQIRWQSVTQQVCLSRTEQLLCFNWDTSTIFQDGRPVTQKFRIEQRGSKLYVPFKFATSKAFQKFSESKIKYDSKNEALVQTTPINLSIPPVVNLGDRYRMNIPIDSRAPYRLLEKGDKRIWVRFFKGRSSGSSVLEGDDVIKEVRIKQKRKSADLIVMLGQRGHSSDVHFDRRTNKLVIDVFTTEQAASSNFPATSVSVPVYTGGKSSRRVEPVLNGEIRTVVIDPGHGGKA